MTAVREFLHGLLRARISPEAFAWLEVAAREANGLADPRGARFPALISLVSRHLPRRALAPSAAELAEAFDLCPGWNPERWTLFDAARVVLVLSRADLDQDGGREALEEAFRYADMGEMCALHRAIAHLPRPQRFVWRAGEGCRSSMSAVYQAAACDTPYPALHFDDVAWRQLVIKALFVEAPLWRVHGLDTRLDDEIARMALDLAEERRSAGRPVQHELWLCLAKATDPRALPAIEAELAGTNVRGRRGAAIALARAGRLDRLSALCSLERDASVRATMESALKGHFHQGAYRDL